MTFKAWLLHMIKSTSDADIAVAKALRYMLKVKKKKFPKTTQSTTIYESFRTSQTVAFWKFL